MVVRTLLATVAIGACVAFPAGASSEIARCRDARGAVTYQPAPCPDRTEESRPQIPASYPEPNKAESQRIFEREAALDRRLEARRDRELQEQQMREARAEREAERERLRQEQLAAQQQYVIAYPLWRGYPGRYPVHHMPRHNPQPIFR